MDLINSQRQSQYKQPAALWWLSGIFALFMYSYGSIFASLTLFLHDDLGVSLHRAYAVFGAFSSMMWTVPLLGSTLLNKIGLRRAVGAGTVCIALGVTLMLSSHLWVCVLGLALFIAGNGFYSPGYWCLVDAVYAKDDIRRESGFTYYYLLFNIGSGVGIILGGVVASYIGHAEALRLDAGVAVLSALLYLNGIRRLHFYPERELTSSFPLHRSLFYAVLALCCVVPLIAILLIYTALNNTMMLLLYGGALLYLVFLVMRQSTSSGRKNCALFILLQVIALIYWVLYSLEPSLLSVYAQHHVQRRIFGMTLPSDALYAFACLFTVLMGLVMSRVWILLSKYQRNPSIASKFCLSILIMGLGFLWLVLGIQLFNVGRALPLLWMILSYAFFATGDLCISPIGIAMVGKLAPKGREGVLMGVWQLTLGVGAVLGSKLAESTVAPKDLSFVQTGLIYRKFFLDIGLAAFTVALLALLCIYVIKKRKASLLLPPSDHAGNPSYAER